MLGPSGCGKTTTLRMIAGFEQPTTGRILLEGKDVSRVPPYRRNVNTVFQHYALFPHMSVYDNVAFGPRSQKLAGGRRRRSGWRSCWRWSGCTQFAAPQAGPALRRPAAAGGAGAGAGQLPQRAPARRAARRARPEAAPGDADRAEADPARGRHHLHLRDPRPGRGADDVGPDRGDERGPGRADRLARGDLSLAELGVRRQFHRRSPTCCRPRVQSDAGKRQVDRAGRGGNRLVQVDRGRSIAVGRERRRP